LSAITEFKVRWCRFWNEFS